MSRWKQTLNEAMNLPGARGAALVDLETGTCESAVAESEDDTGLSLVAQVHARMLRAQMRLAQEQRSDDGVEDLMITFDRNYHLIRPIRTAETGSYMFLCLVMDRAQANLAMTRRKLADLEARVAQRMEIESRIERARHSADAPGRPEKKAADVPAFMRDELVMRLLGIDSADRDKGRANTK